MKTEKVAFKNSRGLKLVGVLHTPEKKTKSMIIMAHGFTGDKDEWGRFVKAAEEFCRSGFAVFRFDFSGSGKSEETAITIKKQVDDLKSAINMVKKKGYQKLGLLGLSLGGLCSILAYNKKIKTIVLWAPATKTRVPPRLQTKEAQLAFKNKGFFVIKDFSGRKFKISKEFVEEHKSINQAKILKKVKCPALIIHGDKDDVVPISHSKNAIKYLPKGSKLEIIKNADHGFELQLSKLISLSLNWFKKYLI